VLSSAIVKETYKPGDFIFFEGDIESHFYIIESGSVQIFTKNKGGKRVDICQLGDGESFGEFALLDKKPRSASAQAVTDVSLVKVSEEGYEQLLEDLPLWATSMMKSFMDRLKSMTQVLKDTDQFLKK
jgi:CRP-like cAMP-binding protein